MSSEEKSEQPKQNNRIKKGDFLLLAGILLFSALFFFAVRLFASKGGVAVVTCDGEVRLTLDLSEDREETIKTDLGTNTVRVKNGEVSVISADCPDKLCEKHSAIHLSGETIVCLPHKLVVEVKAE